MNLVLQTDYSLISKFRRKKANEGGIVLVMLDVHTWRMSAGGWKGF